MASRDLLHRIKSTQSIVAAAHAATVHGTGVDTAGFESVTFILETGTITDGTHTISIEDSPDNSVWTASTAVLGSVPAALTSSVGGSAASVWGYSGGQRYVRVSSTVSGATTGGVYGASVILSHARHSDPQTTQI